MAILWQYYGNIDINIYIINIMSYYVYIADVTRMLM